MLSVSCKPGVCISIHNPDSVACLWLGVEPWAVTSLPSGRRRGDGVVRVYWEAHLPISDHLSSWTLKMVKVELSTTKEPATKCNCFLEVQSGHSLCVNEERNFGHHFGPCCLLPSCQLLKPFIPAARIHLFQGHCP